MIRTAARLSYAFHAQFTALYVETPSMQEAGEKTKQTLKSHLAPSSAKVIRTAARLSYAFHAQFTALYVETPSMQEAGEKTKQTLKSHLELAKALGAKIVTVYGEDAAYQIAEYAIVSNVSKVSGHGKNKPQGNLAQAKDRSDGEADPYGAQY